MLQTLVYHIYSSNFLFVFSIIRKFYWLEVTTIFFLNVDILVSAHNKYLE
jgi:hypothetical protein